MAAREDPPLQVLQCLASASVNWMIPDFQVLVTCYFWQKLRELGYSPFLKTAAFKSALVRKILV
jgi:uncharacterized protein Usg